MVFEIEVSLSLRNERDRINKKGDYSQKSRFFKAFVCVPFGNLQRVFSPNTLHLLFVTPSNFVFRDTIQCSAVCNFTSFVCNVARRVTFRSFLTFETLFNRDVLSPCENSSL